jgi:transcriptional regulator with GAF, ATPase, and Fis domain
MTSSNLIGSSPKFRVVLEEVARVAPVDCSVLIQGETGTGKEVIARAIHEASPRRNHRFVALNGAALPGALLESERFGHERGALPRTTLLYKMRKLGIEGRRRQSARPIRQLADERSSAVANY